MYLVLQYLYLDVKLWLFLLPPGLGPALGAPPGAGIALLHPHEAADGAQVRLPHDPGRAPVQQGGAATPRPALLRAGTAGIGAFALSLFLISWLGAISCLGGVIRVAHFAIFFKKRFLTFTLFHLNVFFAKVNNI